MVKESEYSSKVTGTELNKLPVIIGKNHEDFNNSTKRWVCKNAGEEGQVKIKYHNHIAGKYRGLAYQECSLDLSLSKNNSCCVS